MTTASLRMRTHAVSVLVTFPHQSQLNAHNLVPLALGWGDESDYRRFTRLVWNASALALHSVACIAQRVAYPSGEVLLHALLHKSCPACVLHAPIMVRYSDGRA